MWVTAKSVCNCTTDYLVVQLLLVITKSMGIFHLIFFLMPKKISELYPNVVSLCTNLT